MYALERRLETDRASSYKRKLLVSYAKQEANGLWKMTKVLASHVMRFCSALASIQVYSFRIRNRIARDIDWLMRHPQDIAGSYSEIGLKSVSSGSENEIFRKIHHTSSA